MPILLPLTLLGVGYLIYLVFAGATLALPLALGMAAGLGASRLGCSPLLACVLAVIAVAASSRVAALRFVTPEARIALAVLFALPAALAGYSCGQALGIVAGLIAAVACAGVAAHRILRPAI